MEFSYLIDEDYAVDVLAESLFKGTLVLFLGAGISSGASLPGWPDLIKAMRAKVGLSNENVGDTPDALQDAADEVETKFFFNNKKGFAELVQKCLYTGVKLDESLVTDPTLVALGALLTGSRRGNVNRIVTLNFDCLLEWYARLYGLVPRVILQPPSTEGAEDVRIYHPHGFLPHDDFDAESSDFVILSLRSINKRLSDPNDDWSTLLRHLLTSGMVLFVGMSERSFRDRALAPWLEYAAGKNEKRSPDLPTGFWVLTLEGEEKSAEEIELIEEKFLASRIVPLRQANKERVPKLLLRICQKASQRTAVST
jgi:hypothetical protein